jgi:hypothetical protein
MKPEFASIALLALLRLTRDWACPERVKITSA